MSKESSGIKKNVTNYKTVITFIQSLGTEWNPADEVLKVDQLNIRHAAAEKVHDEFDIIDALDKQKTVERKIAYSSLNDVTRRVFHAGNACKMNALSIERIKTLKDLILGTNKNEAASQREKKAKKERKLLPKDAVMAELPDARSVLQQTFDARYNNFSKLITALETDGNYKTNEADLTIKGLRAYLATLKTANEATRIADNDWNMKIAERNKIITDEVDSIYSDVQRIKMQLKSMKSVSSAQYSEVSKFRFVKIK
jgi:hypothetical protein